MKSNFICFSILMIWGLNIACSPKTETSQSGTENYTLVKVDSFGIKNLTQIVITDYSPVKQVYLGYSTISDELLIIGEKGELINRVSKKGEGPGLYGNWNPTGMSFTPEGNILLEFPFSLVTLSPEFEILSQHRVSSPLPIRTFGPMGKTPIYQINATSYALVGPSSFLPAHYLIMNKEGKDTLQHFSQINLENGNQISVIPYDPESVYAKTDQMYYELMTKTFVVDQERNEMALVTGLDQKILLYDLASLSKKAEIPFEHESFITFPPLPIGTPANDPNYNQHRVYSGRNQRLIHLGGQTYLLHYFKGISEATFLTKSAQNESYSPQEDPEFRSVKLFLDGKALPYELASPSGSMILGLPDNKILVQEPNHPDVEEEEFRFSIYQLKKK
ncbi:hypothetical protein [Algoriphagus sp. AK58]|uniref:hypothetical protein n=1 Tax=Algoriphagus sp. AK58 TaxID=1406877 RepID=UPI0016502BDE|nr:hypothetical protein [Algoriphagus sp. AK58]MBC6368658.1 hypothetical protein [Algoriphagus sp. AK58]